MFSVAISGIVSLIAAIYTLDYYFRRPRDQREPQYVRPTIPVIGHVLGLGKYGTTYFAHLSPGQPEFFTLPLLNFRIYVTNSRHLIPIVQKASRTISFSPFIKLIAKIWVDPSDEFLAMHDDPHQHIPEQGREHRRTLAPGKGLDYQNERTGATMERELSEWTGELGEKEMRVELYTWVRHSMSLAASDGVYGEANPFRDPEVEEAFWLWKQGLEKLASGVPRLFLGKHMEAKATVIAAIHRYLKADHSDASDIILAREKLYVKNGVPFDDMVGAQSTFNVALFGNTAPTAFWTLYDIISRPAFLSEVRIELEEHAVLKHETPGKFSLDVSAIRTACPMLLSSFQETQRTRTVHAHIREIISDTVITSSTTGESYHLSKGNYLQMPSNAVHNDPEVWGPTAATFDPYRFVKDNAPLPKSELPNSYAFLAWGSAPHMCPARQFASTEIMLFVALTILRFDMTPGYGDGKTWKLPEQTLGKLTTVLPAKDGVFVDMRAREGWQGQWDLEMGDSKEGRVPLASG